MARRPKTKTVQKFGGVQEIGHVAAENTINPLGNDVHYDVRSIEAESKTKLEDDEGYGAPAIIRTFEFGVNPEAFAQHRPTKQELFNYHAKGIEIMLWRDGMEVMPDVQPRLVMGQTTYKIFIGAKPARGHILREKPMTLSQIAHGRQE